MQKLDRFNVQYVVIVLVERVSYKRMYSQCMRRLDRSDVGNVVQLLVREVVLRDTVGRFTERNLERNDKEHFNYVCL